MKSPVLPLNPLDPLRAMKTAALLALLPALATASPFHARWTAQPDVGSTTTDLYPPTGTTVNTALFPGETALGFPGFTLTGVEPAAIQTAAAFPSLSEGASSYPLVADEPQGSPNTSDFDIFKYWGNLSPAYSVPSSAYGLYDASPLTPEGCSITQIHLLYRHGARYPTDGAAPAKFAAKLHNATQQSGGFSAHGELDFLTSWTYKLGAELLTPFGRLQNFELGVEMRQQYGYLLNNFTAQGALPVFRTESQDRMVKTAQNFAAGFFGVPEFLDQVSIEIVVEANGYNNTGAPYYDCPNANVNDKGSIGSAVASGFAAKSFNSTIQRLQSQINGVTLTSSDIIAMLQLCSYETDALGYSAFCKLFTEEDFRNYEYYYDLSFYYNNGAGSPVSAAQGKGYLEEYLARFTGDRSFVTMRNSEINTTLDENPTYFPLNQSIYADATHEVVVADTLTAFNLTALFSTGPLDANVRTNSSFVASQVVPFGTRFLTQVMECPAKSPSKQIRFIVNDAVLPIDKSYAGCSWDKDGLCGFDTVVAALKKRNDEIDYTYACYGNYTAQSGMDYNGLPPRS